MELEEAAPYLFHASMLAFLPTIVAATLLAGEVPLPVTSPPVPIIEVIKVYGKLAESDCFGKLAPAASSCQAPFAAVEKTVFGAPPATDISSEEFQQAIASRAFRWPLKPWGAATAPASARAKTATMNKGAETAVFMSELESRGLYDPRDPLGPLPTTQRAALNRVLDADGVDGSAADAVFRAMARGEPRLTRAALEAVFRDAEAATADGDGTTGASRAAAAAPPVLDYYSFLSLIGRQNVIWPQGPAAGAR